MSTSTSPSDPVYDVLTVTLLLKTCTSVDLFRAQLVDPPPRPEERVGFITFFDPGWSILVLRDLVADKRIFYPQDWYNEPFAKLEGPPRYQQLQMEPLKDSFRKTFWEQRALLPLDQEVPLARVVLMGMAIHFLATGQRLFPTCYVRCADETLRRGRRVLVGNFNSVGFGVYSVWDDYRGARSGLASSRRI